MIQRALLRTFFRELIRRARSDTVQAAEKCSRQSVRLVAQIKQPMRAQNRKRAPASPLIIWPAIPHGLGYLLTVQMAYSLQRGAQGYFSIPATRHVAPAPCCAVASVHPPQRHGIQPAP